MPESEHGHFFTAPVAVRVFDREFSESEFSDLMKRASKRAPDPSVFESHPPFFMRSEISNARLDFYYTRQQPSSLKNYAREASTGVAVLLSHNTRTANFGYSLTGTYYASTSPSSNRDASSPSESTPARVESDYFTVQDMTIGGLSTSDVVTSIRSGITRDNSIGFYAGEDGTIDCSICKRDLLTDWDCPHIPGLKYDSEGKRVRSKTSSPDSSPELQLCVGLVENHHLAEYSLVYDGATPGAGLLKAQQMASTGRESPSALRALEHHYRIALPHHTPLATGISIPSEYSIDVPPLTLGLTYPTGYANQFATRVTSSGNQLEEVHPMPESKPPTQESAPADSLHPLITALYAGSGVPPTTIETRSVAQALEWATQELATLRSEVSRLQPLADDGTQYRKDVVDETLTEGVRALGNGFAVESYRALLTSAPLDAIKRMRDDWHALAEKSVPGGRLSLDEPGNPPKPTRTQPRTPAGAYRG